MLTDRVLVLLVAVLVAACTSSQATEPNATTAPTEATLPGRVTITAPLSGSIIYSESLYIAGTAEDVPEEGFRLQVITAEEEVLAETAIQPQDGEWSVEIVHGYSGDPTEASIIALPADTAITQTYQVASIAIMPLSARPQGTFGTILAPQPGDTPGGDVIVVTGRASGVFENTFTLLLEEPDGTEIARVVVTMVNPFYVDDRVWQTELPTNDHTGPAVIRAFAISASDGSEIDLGRVEIIMSRVAG